MTDKLKEAKALFLAGNQLTAISAALGIELVELRHHAFGTEGDGHGDCWEAERSNRRGLTVEEFDLARPHILSAAQAKLLKRIDTAIDEVEIETPADLQKMTDVTEKLHKMERLERGESTDNIDIVSHGVTLRDIMAQYNAKEIEYEE